MADYETKELKALYFDLHVNELRKHFSETNPNGGYNRIRDFLLKRKFSHEQYSGYHSKYKTTDMEIFNLVKNMSKELPWLLECINHFEVTNVGPNHNLKQVLEHRISKPQV